MSAYKNQASKRLMPQKETLNIAVTDAKLKTAKPKVGSDNGVKSGSSIYIMKASE